MGTSKGYIPPTDPKWKNTKTIVNNLGKHGYSTDSIRNAVSKFADAYSGTHLPSSNISNVAAGVLNFLANVQKYGFENAVKYNDLSQLKDLKGLELYNALIDYFAKGVNTTDDQIIRDSLGNTFDKLEIDELKKLGEIKGEDFLLTFLTEFIVRSFEECFAEKIIANLGDLNRYKLIINDVEKIVEEKIIIDNSINNVLSKDYTNEEGKQYISIIIKDTFASLKAMGVITDEDMD